jgi:2-methylcitrate dehydratase PrpD
MSTTPGIARFIAESRRDDIPEPVQDEAVRALIDWLGCCLGGCLDPALDPIGAQGAAATDAASLPGRGRRSDIGSVALFSATASDLLGFAGIHAPSGAPVVVPVASALLPLAEARAAAGADVVHAYALGAEIACRLALASCEARGAPDSSLYAACARIGAAAACARLLELDTSPTRARARNRGAIGRRPGCARGRLHTQRHRLGRT